MFMTGQNRLHAPRSDAQANLRFALARLSADWRHLPPAPLEVLLRHLLMAEHRCMPHPSVMRERPTNRWLLPRIRAWLADTDQLESDIRTGAGVPTGEVRLAVLPSATGIAMESGPTVWMVALIKAVVIGRSLN